MKMMFVSENQSQIALMRESFKGSGIELLHIETREDVKSVLQEQDLLAIVLDLPYPSYTDYCFWSELLTLTNKPVILLSSDQSDLNRMAARQIATVKLAKPVLEFLDRLFEPYPQSDLPGNYIPLAQNVMFDVVQRCIIREHQIYTLTKREFQLLVILVRRMGIPVTAKELLDSVWNDGYAVSLSNLYHYIRKLREKLEKNPKKPEILLTHKKASGGFMLRALKEKAWILLVPVLYRVFKSTLGKIHLEPEFLFIVIF